MSNKPTSATKAGARTSATKAKRSTSAALAQRRASAKASLAARRELAKQRAVELAPILAELRAEGTTSMKGIAKALNSRGVPAARGGPWHTTSVSRLLRLNSWQGKEASAIRLQTPSATPIS